MPSETKAKPKAKSPAKKQVAVSAPKTKFGPRKDLGAPVEGFFANQPPPLRAILDQLRTMISEAAPEATAVTKW